MIPTDAFREALNRARWEPTPETKAALQFVIQELTRPESDGKSKIERILLTCEYENQRNEEIRTAGFALLQKRFKDKTVFFHADCSSHGVCRFGLRIARSFEELSRVQQASGEFFVNLLRPREEWIMAPAVEKPKPAPKPAEKPVPKAKTPPPKGRR